MKTFRELQIEGAPDAINSLLASIQQSLKDGWSRDHTAEKQLSDHSLGHSYCFSCTKTDCRQAASLFLYPTGPNALKVSNVVPAEVGQLTYDEYNYIVKEFHDKFVMPSAAGGDIKVMLSEGNVTIEKWVSPETAKKLHVFSVAANKSTGASHPLDEERWYAFIVSAHQENSRLDPSTLRRWLMEAEEWDEKHAYELSLEYEAARSILTYYDEHR